MGGTPLDSPKVHDGPERFDEVVGEGVGVVLVVVVEGEAGVKSGGAEGAGDHGAKDGVAVVKEGVAGVFVIGAAEAKLAEEGGPIEAAGEGFHRRGVGDADTAGDGPESGTGFGNGEECAGLRLNFCGDNVPPKPFPEWEGRGGLPLKASGLAMMGDEGEHHGDGQVFGVARDEDGVGRGKFGEDGLGEGDLAMAADDGGDVVEGDGRVSVSRR